jgi:hypothetical protein
VKSLRVAVFVLGIGCALSAAQGVGIDSSGAATPAPQKVAFPGTGFGGYNWFGPVSQISATWQVPVIARNSNAGHASTWVGAQPRKGGLPFIQLGTVEDDWGPRQIEYRAFWSDTAKDFHPQMVAVVRPGDLVSASMIRTKDSWKLSFDDLTSHRSKDITVQYGAGRVPNQAEWMQEDPSPGDVTATDLPYPAMSTVTLQHLKVNNGTPSLARTDARVLLPSNGGYLVPTSFRSDSFTFVQAQGLARAYLIDARQLDASIALFEVAGLRWNTDSKAERLLAVQTAEQGYAANAALFQRLNLPMSDQPALQGLETHLQLVVGDFRVWIQSGLETNSPASSALVDDQMAVHDYADQIRSDVGLPPT